MNRVRKFVVITVPAVVFAGVVLAVGVEVWTRARWDDRKGTPGFFVSHPVRVQQLSEGYNGWFAGVPTRINRLGFRDNREYQLAKSPRTIRIVVLGDSVTFGHGSIYEHSYPFLLEQRLKAWRPDVDWQVWNLGVPGYNTSQELAQLLELGPRFDPDLVVVGFYENDIVDNFPVRDATALAKARSAVLSWLYRHVYSIEFYKRLYLQLAWRWSGQNSYRLRLAHVAEEEQLTAIPGEVKDLPAQQLTAYDRRSDADVTATDCPKTPSLPADILAAIQREPGWNDWVAAVRGLQQLNRDRIYSIAFFANVAPRTCEQDDVFMDGGSAALNRFYLNILSDGTAAVSAYDAFLPLRPSQMPDASGHSLGNANVVKADVLFAFLRDTVLSTTQLRERASTILRARAP
jgi:GDSL-like Lipase/Acylhydrolase family